MHLRAPSAQAMRQQAPPDTRLYAVGDVHGRLDLLERLLLLIEEDAKTSSARRRCVIFLGDYVDRGPDSRGVIDRLAAGPPPGFSWICLRGNHEEFMLRFLDDLNVGPAWIRNGGFETVASYAGSLPQRTGLSTLQALLRLHLPRAHYDFLAQLPTHHVEGDYFFAHAGVRPGVALEEQSADDLLWIRGEFLGCQADFGKTIVHGHSIASQPAVCANRIGVDTGAYASGHLTAMVAEGADVHFLST